MSESNRIVVVGGVAGGASAAARARRLCEGCEIVVFESGPYVSFANCGLPYRVGDVIQDESRLLVASPELFKARFNIDVRTMSDVVSIDRDAQTVHVREVTTGREYDERWDHLVLAPGASAIVPPLPGVELPGVFSLRTIPDSRDIRAWIESKNTRRAVVVGAGFIGLEVAENLVHRGLEVTVVDLADQVLPPLDPEMAVPVAQHLEERGVALCLGDGLAGVESSDGRDELVVSTQSGARFAADLVILGIGVRPRTELARDAGLEIGAHGGIHVDASMRTSDPRIFAVGDAIEVTDVVTGVEQLVPLAGPANRQGRIAADVINGRDATFRGVQATAVCGVFDLTVAATGASEKALRQAGVENFDKVYLHPGHHVGYYPGAEPIRLKVIFSRSDGCVLGAQAIGKEGAERRVDVIAMAIQMGATVHDLAEAELCYAPQYGAAKDPVNFAGMIASNSLAGDQPLVHWDDLDGAKRDGVFLVDVREPSEFDAGHVDGAVNIPLGQVRDRLDEFPRDRATWVYCGVGQRAYYATRVLAQSEIDVHNVSGGILTWRYVQEARAAGGQR